MDMHHFWINLWRVARFLLVAFIIITGCITVYYTAQYTYPFIIAIGIAFLMNPLVNLLENKAKVPRPLSVFLTILLILAAIIGVIVLLVVELIDGFNNLANIIPSHFKDLVSYVQGVITAQVIPFYQRLTTIINTLDPTQQEKVLEQIQTIGTKVAESGATWLKLLLNSIPSQLGKLPNLATIIIFSLLGTFFISKDWYKLKEKILQFAPEPLTVSSGNVLKGLQKALFGFMKAQFTLISITAFIVLAGLLILRVDYAVTIAMITGAVDLLPYLGTGFIFIPWIIYMFFTGNYFMTIGLSILYIIVIVQRQMMEPKVLSTNIGLDPLATLVALFVGFKMFSFLGLIIGPVTLVILNTLYRSGVFHDTWRYILGRSQ
ncbi:sporulation integral membrane protein YtvI [Pontibacillus sp. HMF3514]|uniref:sporulation integral membrane protein YtvI n=1 Tax=Pontibacillus sp. HMF3514 TaxID=2692425 RepID=UPI00131F4E2D|nr:sporulation integral membrane protein YtvI [Pontibacillus sp. HMF3514]QHE53230.1 sporulation integral membrane protein YtvI [Pontibacillus sp. HMF3514]